MLYPIELWPRTTGENCHRGADASSAFVELSALRAVLLVAQARMGEQQRGDARMHLVIARHVVRGELEFAARPAQHREELLLGTRCRRGALDLDAQEAPFANEEPRRAVLA